jgi:two-component system sensor histidine kinase LytS
LPSGWLLVLKLAQSVSLIGILGYLVTRLPAIRNALTHSRYDLHDKIVLGIIFGFFSAVGNWMSVEMNDGSLANTRIINAIAGGLLGGPLVGLLAGIIGAIPRYFIGGFTMWAAVLSNIIAGIIGGQVYRKCGPRKIKLWIAALTALCCEGILKLLVLITSKPFEAAWQLESIIAVPTTLINTLAVVFIVYIVHDVFSEQEKVQVLSAQQAIRVIHSSSGFMQYDLNADTAEKIADIIYNETKAAAVAVTNVDKVLAFIGEGSDHHQIGTPLLTAVTKQMIKDRHVVIYNDRHGVGCPICGCKLSAVVEAPLIVSNEFVGSIKLFKANNEEISSHEAELIQGIADFLSLQLTQKKLEDQQMLLLQTECQMLKAQIHPHFFFNTLGTIQSLIFSRPELADTLIKEMAEFFRKTLNRDHAVISVEEELKSVRNYVNIEKIRYGDRINIIEELPDQFLGYMIPISSVQFLVENAIRHGVSTKRGRGTVRISSGVNNDSWYICVEDDGLGIPEERLSDLLKDKPVESVNGMGIGLLNIQRRIQKLYGLQYGLQIKSQPNKGTVVTINFPYGRSDSLYASSINNNHE